MSMSNATRTLVICLLFFIVCLKEIHPQQGKFSLANYHPFIIGPPVDYVDAHIIVY